MSTAVVKKPLMIKKQDLFQVKRYVEGCLGKTIKLRINKGRKKAFMLEGVLESIYPSIFVMKFENDYDTMRRVSYSYTDVLTKAVEFMTFKTETEGEYQAV